MAKKKFFKIKRKTQEEIKPDIYLKTPLDSTSLKEEYLRNDENEEHQSVDCFSYFYNRLLKIKIKNNLFLNKLYLSNNFDFQKNSQLLMDYHHSNDNK